MNLVLAILWTIITVMNLIAQESIPWWEYCLATTLISMMHYIDHFTGR